MVSMNNTIGFKITFGVNEGYFHANENTSDNLNKVSDDIILMISQVANEPYGKGSWFGQKRDIYVSGILTPANICYPSMFGCPQGGEKGFIYSGCMNPAFVENKNCYMQAVESLAKMIKKKYQQSTVTVEFTDTEMVYLQNGGVI
jgi:hypothetical protein